MQSIYKGLHDIMHSFLKMHATAFLLQHIIGQSSGRALCVKNLTTILA